MLKYDSFRLPIKYMITPCIPKLLLKSFSFFSSCMKISGKNVSFAEKKIKKMISTKTKK